MRITADTNILVRALLDDDRRQSELVRAELSNADVVVVTLPSLCELAWVLGRGYKLSASDVSKAIRHIAAIENVALDRPAVEAGLAMLEAGGDFADGVIAHQGNWLGGEIFLSFDKQAVKLLQGQGQAARVPA